uniref:Uncharacterized protein n=1 Tax=Rhizochromulina marina TaxID=1034831 RepID=A0A7S2W900_9STRA|mmetsp:Transcript_1830/g.5386  ORF Transcript_1830/g.5386 Transcript_1830/m.5386 type:complete len:369 (+) Transcript_1830:233-1339(+)
MPVPARGQGRSALAPLTVPLPRANTTGEETADPGHASAEAVALGGRGADRKTTPPPRRPKRLSGFVVFARLRRPRLLRLDRTHGASYSELYALNNQVNDTLLSEWNLVDKEVRQEFNDIATLCCSTSPLPSPVPPASPRSPASPLGGCSMTSPTGEGGCSRADFWGWMSVAFEHRIGRVLALAEGQLADPARASKTRDRRKKRKSQAAAPPPARAAAAAEKLLPCANTHRRHQSAASVADVSQASKRRHSFSDTSSPRPTPTAAALVAAAAAAARLLEGRGLASDAALAAAADPAVGVMDSSGLLKCLQQLQFPADAKGPSPPMVRAFSALMMQLPKQPPRESGPGHQRIERLASHRPFLQDENGIEG